MTDKKVLKIQFYLNIILAVVLLFKYNDVYFWGYLIILVLTLLLSKNAKAFKLLSIIFFPIIFVDQFTFLINLLIKLLPHFITIIYFFLIFYWSINFNCSSYKRIICENKNSNFSTFSVELAYSKCSCDKCSCT